MFEPREDDENYIASMIDKEKNVVLGIYPVIYGMRVVAGFAGDNYYRCTWCCALNQEMMHWAYSALKAIIDQREPGEDVFQGIPPHSDSKPFMLDGMFLMTVSKMADAPNFEILELPPVLELRRRYGEVSRHFLEVMEITGAPI